MSRDVLIAVVGVPTTVCDYFATKFGRLTRQVHARHVLTRPLDLTTPYSQEFAKDVYARLVGKLKPQPWSRENLLSNVNVILLYLDKEDGSDNLLLDHLGVEVLPVPIHGSAGLLDTPRHQTTFANSLVQDARSAMIHGRRLLRAISEEVTTRDNKTCLLLPPRTFGPDMERVTRLVHEAARRKNGVDQFTTDVRRTGLTQRNGCFEGSGGKLFVAPAKAGPRHGLPPTWDDDHPPRCVVRGRLRFGVPFNPRFHYDCQLRRRHPRQLPGCHEPQRLRRSRRHVNIAPNDAVR